MTRLRFSAELDPRLRRLLHGVAGAAGAAGAGQVTAAGVAAGRTKVLVEAVDGEVRARAADELWVRVTDTVWSVELPVAELGRLAASPGVRFVESGRPFSPQPAAPASSLAATRADLVHQAEGGGLTGAGVVVGIIDFGLDVTLDDFRRPDGTTRIAALWDQGLAPRAGERSPDGFPYGTEYDAAAIDAALAAPDPFAVVRHVPPPGSHGTHVCGTAVGNGRSAGPGDPPAVGVAPEATIVFVQPALDDPAGTFTDSAHVADAVAYVFARADQLGLPCVVNMSLGQNGGSHDGESIVERAIDRLLEQPGRAMTVAAGNEHVWRGHASGTLVAGATRTLRWGVGGGMPLGDGRVLPAGAGDESPNELEVWYSSVDALAVVLTDPTGESTPSVAPGETVVHTFASGARAFLDSERFSRLNGDARIYVSVAPADGATLPAGDWQVALRGLEVRSGRFDAWIERDVRLPGNAFADQSYFGDDDFDDVMTLGTPATARRAIAVANYDHRTLQVHESSSRGPTRDGRWKPEVAAPGTDVVSSGSLGGRPGPGGAHPVRVAMTGTSMAAPHVAGVVALMFQREPTLQSAQLTRMLAASADPVPEADRPFDVAWGSGRVDARRAVEVVLGVAAGSRSADGADPAAAPPLAQAE